MYVTLNINDYVEVQLTDIGRRQLRALGYDYPCFTPDAEGWSRFQWHELMYLFGPELYNGNMNLPFKPTVRLERTSL